MGDDDADDTDDRDDTDVEGLEVFVLVLLGVPPVLLLLPRRWNHNDIRRYNDVDDGIIDDDNGVNKTIT